MKLISIKNPTIGEILSEYPSQIENTFGPKELDVQELLAKVTGNSRAHVMASPEQKLTPLQFVRFQRLFAKRKDLWPPQYLLGEIRFDDIDLKITPSVLIPRPETETLVEIAKKYIEANPIRNVVDLGTGSGCIIISLAKKLASTKKEYNFIGTDKSLAALRIARTNAKRNNVLINFRIRDFISKPNTFLPLTSWVLISNPPYLNEKEMSEITIRHEPRIALYGGPDGLNDYRTILTQTAGLENKPKAIFFEIGYKQGKSLSEIVKEHFPAANITVHQDYCGKDRVMKIEL